MQDFLFMHVRHASADVLEDGEDGRPPLREVVCSEEAPLYGGSKAASVAKLLHTHLLVQCRCYSYSEVSLSMAKHY